MEDYKFCILLLIQGKIINCMNERCMAWSEKDNNCLLVLSLQTYTKTTMVGLELLRVANRLNKIADEIEEGEEGDNKTD